MYIQTERKERKGEERKGKERKGKERKGKVRKGKERKGKERKGKGEKKRNEKNQEMSLESEKNRRKMATPLLNVFSYYFSFFLEYFNVPFHLCGGLLLILSVSGSVGGSVFTP